ncbi:MAG: hypothetical protein IT453_06715, partial [Planctomycetes bacterium]|nr:hypothetical protein [Planctomycetota bacterium]
RFVVLSPAASAYVEHAAPLIDKTFDLAARALPTPPPRTVVAEAPARPAAKTANEPGPLPEDPEEPPAGAPPPTGKSSGAEVRTVTAVELAPAPAVILLLQDHAAYARSVQYLVELESYLKPWVDEASTESGYALERPLCGSMVIDQPDQEEWNPDNEIVNRCMQLAVLQRAGRQPNWIMQGLGWYAEFQLQRSAYCFPYRHEFVSIAEHTDWDELLANRYGDRDATPLAFADLVACKRGSWNTAAAHRAWGAIDYLVRKDAVALSSWLQDLRAETVAKSRRDLPDGTWITEAGFELPAADQERLLLLRFGPKVVAEMQRAWTRAGERKR